MNEIILTSNEVKGVNFEDCEESFVKYLDVSDKTLRAYKVGVECFLNYLREKKIKEPTRNDIISFRDYLRKNYSSNTVNSYMIAVRSLFKYLEIHKLYENITINIKGARYDNTPKKEVLTSDVMKEIYNNLTDKREKAVFGLMVTTGLRAFEVADALIEDIKTYNGEVVLFFLGKMRDSKDEYVKLSPQVLNDIKEYIGDRKSGHIFVSHSNHNKNGGMTTTSLRRIVKNIFKRFGIEKDTISCHSLRRSFAVASYESGSSIYDIQQVLHHKSIQTTTRYLKQVDRDKNKTEYNVSNMILGGI